MGDKARVRNEKIVKPIVYGNTATPFGYKREKDFHTHHWTAFLRLQSSEDPSKFIRKVQFKLHDSYPNNIRVVDKPPYELSETGWGEFEMQFKIFFVDPREKAVTGYFYVRLYRPEVKRSDGTTFVRSEFHDELIFQNPTIMMYPALTDKTADGNFLKPIQSDLYHVMQRTMEFAKMANEEVKKEVADLTESLRAANQLIIKYAAEKELQLNERQQAK